jgi:hypothetical protein
MNRLEQYTIKKSDEVLLVKTIINDEEDEIIIFKGFSSSLMNPTAFDPDIPVLPENAIIVTIDRLKSPYNPHNPQYLEKDLTWEKMEELLTKIGL